MNEKQAQIVDELTTDFGLTRQQARDTMKRLDKAQTHLAMFAIVEALTARHGWSPEKAVQRLIAWGYMT